MSCRSAARRRSRSSRVVRAERGRDAHHDQARAVGVAVGPRRLRVDDPAKASAIRSSRVVVDGDVAVARLPGAEVVVVQRRPRTPRRRTTGAKASTSAGSNHSPLRRRATSCAARGPAAAWKISAVWARQRIRPSSGISSPRRPRGWPPPSQCSSSARIPSAVSRLEAEHERDLGAAVAARLHQRARDLALGLDRAQPVDPARGRRLRGATVRTDHRNAGSRARPVDRAWTSASRRGRRRRTAPPSWPSWPSSRRP